MRTIGQPSPTRKQDADGRSARECFALPAIDRTMEANLQRRLQRYGWDRAADDYEPLWQTQLARAQTELLARAAIAPGERVLDVACGTGLVTFAAARACGESGSVIGVDLSEQMIVTARRSAERDGITNVEFARMDAERLAFPDASFDVVLCALGLMYVPHPERALQEMRRVLRPGGRLGVSVWGERSQCGWASVFEIVDAEVASEVCPLFFSLGQKDALTMLCEHAGFERIEQHRLTTTLDYATGEEACDAAFVGGPVALAWSRFDADVRARARKRYLETIDAWRQDSAYRLPGEFVIVSAASAG